MTAKQVRNDAEIRLGGADAAKLWRMTSSNARGLIGPLVTTLTYLDEQDSSKETDAA